ncbi:MAG: CoA-binding protein [Chloroflexota bacterium]|nr:CoA-binding protein [Chloroflexota bacterium]
MSDSLEFLFHPRSIALPGITISNPDHWTRTFLNSLLEIQFEGSIYPINPKGGEIQGLKVFRSLEDISGTIDYAISTVPARAAPKLVEECAHKGVKSIHFCTAGFSETGEKESVKLEAELAQLATQTGIRIIGPNCMGIYCPKARLSFNEDFPRESGSVGYISQSGGNTTQVIRQAMWRGVRFSKAISYGNACDLNESDFLEYLTYDPDTRIIALYIEGVKDGERFRQALREATKAKPVVLLKGGVTKAGTRAVAGHTGALAGSEATWNALCNQLGIIRVHSLEELVDVLVTFSFIRSPGGRNVALLGFGGGASVLITDEFETRGLAVPPLPQELRSQIEEFTPLAGNILRNPIDYSQVMESDKMVKLIDIISEWDEIDILVEFLRLTQAPPSAKATRAQTIEKMFEVSKTASKPVATVIEPGILPEEAKESFIAIQKLVSLGLPVYYSFTSAANALSVYLSYQEREFGNRGTRRHNR